ncbi:MAG: helix-turn-helix domain-containing protein [Candidatus Pacebacteria bacterium]|nr:helix-turn-helix domain-containing protein [Candidatus Paceibacterota bacterium]
MIKEPKVKKILTIGEASEMLGVTVTTLRKWDKNGHFKALRIGTRKGVGDRRYRLEDIKKYLIADK